MLKPIRTILGLVIVLHAAELYAWGFGRNGGAFLLPLVPGLDLVPGWLNALTLPVLAVCGFGMVAGSWGACLGAAGLVFYHQTRSFFGFHDGDWLLLQACTLVGLWTRADAGGDARTARDFRAALCALVAVVYFVAGLNKLNSEFLSGAVISAILPGSSPVRWLPGGCALLAWGTAATELSLPVLLCFRRARPLAVAMGLGMHAGILLSTFRGSIFHVYAPLGMLAFGLERRERNVTLVTLSGLWLWCAWGIVPRVL